MPGNWNSGKPPGAGTGAAGAVVAAAGCELRGSLLGAANIGRCCRPPPIQGCSAGICICAGTGYAPGAPDGAAGCPESTPAAGAPGGQPAEACCAGKGYEG